SATARRASEFLSTRKYIPDSRAFARSRVILPTSSPRYSATMMACAVATWAPTSATTAFFSSRFRLKVVLHQLKCDTGLWVLGRGAGNRPISQYSRPRFHYREPATLNQESNHVPVLGTPSALG